MTYYIGAWKKWKPVSAVGGDKMNILIIASRVLSVGIVVRQTPMKVQ